MDQEVEPSLLPLLPKAGLPSGESFHTLREAGVPVEARCRHHGAIRPHSARGCRPPAPDIPDHPLPRAPAAHLTPQQDGPRALHLPTWRRHPPSGDRQVPRRRRSRAAPRLDPAGAGPAMSSGPSPAIPIGPAALLAASAPVETPPADRVPSRTVAARAPGQFLGSVAATTAGDLLVADPGRRAVLRGRSGRDLRGHGGVRPRGGRDRARLRCPGHRHGRRRRRRRLRGPPGTGRRPGRARRRGGLARSLHGPTLRRLPAADAKVGRRHEVDARVWTEHEAPRPDAARRAPTGSSGSTARPRCRTRGRDGAACRLGAGTPQAAARDLVPADFASSVDGTRCGRTHAQACIARREPGGGVTGSTAAAVGRTEADAETL